MDTEMLNSPSDKTVSRKNFLLAATGLAAYLGSGSRAKATDTNYAYLDASTPFTANQYFGNITAGTSTSSGPVRFESGYPWIDVMSPVFNVTQGSGLTSTQRTANTTGINNAIALAIVSGGTGGTGNFTVYFPPGNYEINGTILPPNSASNYMLMGAGPGSSVISWQGSAGSSMLRLVNARGVTIRGLGFFGNISAIPTYGIEINRGAGWTTGTPYPTDIVVESVYLGNPAGLSLTNAIAYTVDSGFDQGPGGTPFGFGTFRDVSMANVGTGYKFGAGCSYGNIVIGGLVNGLSYEPVPPVPPYCYGTGIDNTPGPNSTFGYGGAYTTFGHRIGQTEMMFTVGASQGLLVGGSTATLGYPINVFGVKGEPNDQMLTAGTSTTAIGPQMVQFFGGLIKGLDLPNSSPTSAAYNTLYFNSNGGQFELHDILITTASNDTTAGGRWNFPGSAAVACYGGALCTQQWIFNGPLQRHGMWESRYGDNIAYITNVGSGTLQDYNHYGMLAGICTAINTHGGFGSSFSNIIAGGGSSSMTIQGSAMGGLITVNTGPSTAGQTGTLVQITLPSARKALPTVILLPTEPNATAAISTVYNQSTSNSTFAISVASPLTASVTYQWIFFIV